MRLMQRFSDHVTEEYIKKYVEAMKKYPGACDDVWLASKYGYPKPEVHKSYARELKKYEEYIRRNGMRVSLQISNTIGHGAYMASRDCTGLVFDGSPVRKLVGHDGMEADYCFCWRDAYFRDYLLQTIVYYAEAIQPECVWIDDDFRARNHDPVAFGCFCGDCMKTFNEQYGSHFSRETLLEEMLHGDLLWRERYIAFLRRGLYDLMYEISCAVHRASPKTVMGLQHGPYGAYTGFGYDFIFNAMRDATGLNPCSRPGGGAYCDHDPNEFLKKTVELSWQNATLPEYVKTKCPEIENLPFCAFGKSPAGTAFETSCYFAGGNTDMSYSMNMTENEPMDWHEKEFRLFAEHRVYWEKMSEVNRNSFQGGLRFVVSKDTWKRKLEPWEDIYTWTDEHYAEAFLWTRTGIPIAYDRKEEAVFLLHPECAKALSHEEIEELLGKNVLTDGETLAILAERGYSLGIEAREIPQHRVTGLFEQLSENPVNAGMKRWIPSRFHEGRNACYSLNCTNETAEILAEYRCLQPLDEKHNEFGYAADLIFQTPKNARWAVFGFAPWKGVMSFARREQILNAADKISGKGLCARVLSPFQVCLLPRKNADGKTVCVSLINCTVGESGELELLVRNPAGEKFTCMGQYLETCTLKYEKTNDGYRLKLPSIPPWSVATVFISEK